MWYDMMLKILSKKHVRDILYLLEGHEKLYVSQIQQFLNIDIGNLSSLLRLLLKNGLVDTKKIYDGAGLPKTYYWLTKKGKDAIVIYEMCNKLDNTDTSKHSISIGNNHGNISIGNNNIVGDNINIKK
jgi:DNA-binding HxlR family transcriptional regulator